MIRFLLATIVAMFITTNCTAKTIDVDTKRAVVIQGVINMYSLDVADRIVQLSKESDDDIWLVINSPGGQVLPALQILSAMKMAKERGVYINCVTTIMSASAAFQILVNCDERFALKHTLLMWHPMKIFINGRLSASDLLYESRRLSALEKPLIKDLIRTLEINPRKFQYHYLHETIWTAETLTVVSPNFIEIIDDVTGVANPFSFK